MFLLKFNSFYLSLNMLKEFLIPVDYYLQHFIEIKNFRIAEGALKKSFLFN